MSVALAGAHQSTISRSLSASGEGAASPTPLSPHERSTAIRMVGGSATLQPTAIAARAPEGGPKHRATPEPTAGEVESEDEAAIASAPTIEDGPPPSIDDAAESAFLADARERGEAVPRKSAADVEEETIAKKPLPPLDELVNQIPADVREVLEDLFRARFVSVKRFPKKALKSDK